MANRDALMLRLPDNVSQHDVDDLLRGYMRATGKEGSFQFTQFPEAFGDISLGTQYQKFILFPSNTILGLKTRYEPPARPTPPRPATAVERRIYATINIVCTPQEINNLIRSVP